MIIEPFNEVNVLYQTADSKCDMANPAIVISMDAGDTVVVNQEGSEICLNKASIPELVKILNKMKNLSVMKK